jgi:hypothetical protein
MGVSMLFVVQGAWPAAALVFANMLGPEYLHGTCHDASSPVCNPTCTLEMFGWTWAQRFHWPPKIINMGECEG